MFGLLETSPLVVEGLSLSVSGRSVSGGDVVGDGEWWSVCCVVVVVLVVVVVFVTVGTEVRRNGESGIAVRIERPALII